MNYARVVLGGLLAGLVLNIGEFLLHDFMLGNQMKDFMSRHNFPDPGVNFMIVAVGLTFVMGIVLVLGYALIRPRLGPGPKTAIITGLLAWFCVYFYCGVIDGFLFGIPTATMVMVLVWGLVQYAVAAIAGAWLYKEA